MSLYRKYRPILFADIAGQEHIKRTLQNEITLGKTVHAYLFSGPRAVGKTTTARIFARAINCTKRTKDESEPCNDCDPCTSILDGKAMDILEIDAASHTGVDNVRENIIAAARVVNSTLSYKVFIIDEVHMLSISAFNALLKLIEEPPAGVIFILATTELHKVPATIISRCQRFDFRKISPEDMRARLTKIIAAEKKKVDDDVVGEVIRLSSGCERDAESLLGQLLSLDEHVIDKKLASLVLPYSSAELVDRLVGAIIERNTQVGVEIANTLIDEGVDLPTFINDVIDYFRDIMLIKSGASDAVNANVRARYESRAALVEQQQVLEIINHFITAQKDARWFTIPQLPLEMAVVKSCMVVLAKA